MVELDGVNLELSKDGIVTITHHRDSRFDERMARQLVDAHAKVADGRKLPILSRTIADFFVRVTRPIYPTRMFTDLDQARAWLLSGRRDDEVS